jgi:hypothetical protein
MEETVRSYQRAIDAISSWCFVVQPVGKYTDPSLSLDLQHGKDTELVDMVMRTGLLRDVIDISDMDQVQAQVPKFLDAYRPGAGWVVVTDAHHPAYPHYWQGLYRKS